MRVMHVPDHDHRSETNGHEHAPKDQRDPEEDPFDAVQLPIGSGHIHQPLATSSLPAATRHGSECDHGTL